MNNYGIVYDIKNDKAVVLTRDGNFVMIRRREDIFLGQQIAFDDEDICRLGKKYYKFASIGVGLAAVCVLILAFLRIMPVNIDIYGYVAVDINPSMEFGIDENYKVIKAIALNDDAAKLIGDINVKHKPIEVVVVEIVKESKKRGYIDAKEKTDILISASLMDENKKAGTNGNSSFSDIDKLLNEIEREIEGLDSNIDGKTLRIASEVREAARRYDISMGKYDLYLKLNKLGENISIDKINSMKISDLMKIIEEKEIESSAQGTKGSESNPANALIPEETADSEQTPKNIVTPTPISTLVELPRNSQNSGAVSDSSAQPTKDSDHRSASEGNKILKLKHYNEQQSLYSKAIRWDFVIENTGNSYIDLRNVKVRYYFKDDYKNINFAVYFYSLGDEKNDVKGKVYNIRQSDSSHKYLEVTFEKGSIPPGDAAWVFGAITRDDWTEFNQEDDWSFLQGNSTFSYWDKMTVYISDKLVWGIEPY
ncbi:cellulose binding domain-containing protein [Acetivibrio clariflavus]|uniref:anti-sigma-I factor RsgI family protein n=1 Tax=Acetivibrio clariflavus TaxID=288965 RepID=UPI0031F593D9